MKVKELIVVELRLRKEAEECGIYNKALFLFKSKYNDVERNIPTSYQ